MSSTIRNPKNFLTGLLFAAIGLGCVVIARDYGIGTARHMGPGYFPTLLGGLLTVIGIVLAVSARFGEKGSIDRFAWLPLLIVVAATIVFGLLIRSAGLVPAVAALAAIGLVASIKFRVRTALALACALAMVSWVVFTWALGLPMPAFGTWFGN